MGSRRWIVRMLGSLVAGVLGWLLFVPASVCGCITTDMWFARFFRVSPSTAGASAIRSAVLTRLPVGSARADVEALVARLQGPNPNGSIACKTRPDGATIACDLLTEASLLGVHELRVHIELSLAEGRLTDAHVDKARVLLGLRLPGSFERSR